MWVQVTLTGRPEVTRVSNSATNWLCNFRTVHNLSEPPEDYARGRSVFLVNGCRGQRMNPRAGRGLSKPSWRVAAMPACAGKELQREGPGALQLCGRFLTPKASTGAEGPSQAAPEEGLSGRPATAEATGGDVVTPRPSARPPGCPAHEWRRENPGAPQRQGACQPGDFKDADVSLSARNGLLSWRGLQ